MVPGRPRIASGAPAGADPQVSIGSVAAGDLAGDWLWDSLGLRIQVDADVYGRGLHGMVGLALRRNPRRAHLLVSRVLGKHLPVPPATALDAGALLARQVQLVRGGADAAGGVVESGLPGAGVGGAGVVGAGVVESGPLVLGYCETATALGHAVADALPGSYYLHTTRRSVLGMRPLLAFTESHSHATHHWVIPADVERVRAPRPLVLVDDELSTGDTALGTIRALHAFAPRPSYTVAALLDARPKAARAAFESLADDLGVPVDVVSLLSATVRVPPDVAQRAQRVRQRFGAGAGAANRGDQSGAGRDTAAGAAGRRAGWGDAGHRVVHLSPDWPRELPDGGRHGWLPATRTLLDAVLPGVAAGIAARLTLPGRRTLVLGTEELMYTPMRLAAALAERTGGDVLYQSTTRSPVYPVDVPGYAIRSALTFPAPDDPARTSSVYNVRPGRYDDIVVVADSGADAASPSGATAAQVAGMVAELRRCAPVTVVTLPAYVPAAAR
jgi:hypothetical protein